MTDTKELRELLSPVEIDMIQHGDMIGPALGAKVLSAIDRLEAERDENGRQSLHFHAAYTEADDNLRAAQTEVARLRTKLRDMHRRAQRAEGRADAAAFAVDLWLNALRRQRGQYLTLTILGQIKDALNRHFGSTLYRGVRARAALDHVEGLE